MENVVIKIAEHVLLGGGTVMRKIALVAVPLLVLSTSASGYSGYDIVEFCNPEFSASGMDLVGAYRAGVCTGLAESLMAFGRKLGACLPEKVTVGQMMLVLYKYMDRHPELLDQDITLLGLGALLEAFPCSKPAPDHP